MVKKKIAEEKRNTRMATQQPLKQSGSLDVPHRMDLLERPRLINKGTVFTEEERSKLGLHGLLPHVGVADGLRAAMKDERLSEQEARSRFWVVDKDGLLHSGRTDLTAEQRVYAQPTDRVSGWPGTSIGEIGLADVIGKIEAAPLRSVLSRQKNIRVLLSQVVDIDPLSKRVLLADGASFEYDSLIISAGSQTSYYEHDAWREWARARCSDARGRASIP
jgi:hypothetical protein